MIKNDMKKALMFPVFLLFSLFSVSQEINKYGHFIKNNEIKSEYKIIQKDGNYKISVNGQLLDGNCLFEATGKKITVTAIEENVPSVLRIYSLQGNLIYEKKFPQTINPELNINKAYFSFYSNGSLFVLNLQTMSMKTYKSSMIYYVDPAGIPVYFDSTNIIYKENAVEIIEIPAKILQFKGQVLVFTRNNLYLLTGKEVKNIFSFHGTFFDSRTQADTLKFVLKEKIENGFRFTLFKTNDLQIFKEGENKDYLTNHQNNNVKNNGTKKTSKSGSHEDIRGPLNYYNDTAHYRIGNGYAELQDYGGGPYLHPGVDFLGVPDQEVYAVKTGVVKAILTTGSDLYWRIAISNNNTSNESVGYLYAHLNQLSIPYTVGDSVYEGDIIGTLVFWTWYDFHHTHFARIKESGTIWDGSWWTVNNPLVDVTNLVDTIKPVFDNSINNDLFAFRDTNGVYLSPDSIYGDVDIISKIYDRCNCTYKIDVYQIRYSLSPVSSPGAYLFDTLAFRFDMPVDMYVGAGDYSTLLSYTIYSYDMTCQSLADYDFREYYHIITNSNGVDTITDQNQSYYFHSPDYPDGQYYLKVIAKDASMNTAMDSMIINIKNGVSYINTDSHKKPEITIFPNPSKNFLIIKFPKNEKSVLTIYNSRGQEIHRTESMTGKEIKIETINWPSGIYFFNLLNNNGTSEQGKFIKE